jgi:hypothetical protein
MIEGSVFQLARPEKTVWLVALLSMACSSPETTPPPSVSEVSRSRCIEVSPELLDGIASELDEAEGNLERGVAVKSADHDSLYFISARVVGSNATDEGIGTWTTSSLVAGVGSVFSVDSVAHSVSNWPRSADDLSERDDGFLDSRNCVAD